MTKARDIASAAPAPSTVSATELGYLDGVSSAIQTQIDSKIGSASAISPTLIDAKGDLIVGSAADTAVRLAVGTNNHVLTADSSTATGLKWAAAAGGGKVLQVVSTTYSTETIIASTTLTDTGISLSITPTSATSKVLILIQANVYNTRLTVTAANKARLLRGATTLLDWTNDGFNYIEITGATAARLISQSVVQYLDSPATTSSTTYKLQAAAYNTANSGQVIFQNGNLPSVITLLEIGA